MTNVEVELKLKSLVHEERRITKEIVLLLNEAEDRKIHLERGFSSLFDWLVRGFGYSESAAYRRIEAARMERAVPGVAEKIELGDLNLTNVAKARAAIRAQQKATGQKLTMEEQVEVVSSVENKTASEADQVLFTIFPETASRVHQEKVRPLNENTTRISVNLTNEALADIEWAKDFLSHSLPEGGLGEVIASVFKRFRDKNDVLRRGTDQNANASSTSAAEKPRSKAAAKRVTFQRANGQCEYVDPDTGKRCTATYQVQVDHVVPRALGGLDDSSNYRCLCRAHNILMAEKILGPQRANRWRASEAR